MTARFGLSQESFRFIQEKVVLPLESMGAEVWCFGSRARGDYRTFSDLDLMICGASENLRATLGAIQESLIESPLPIKVELILFQDFASSYREGFQRDKVRFPAG